MAITPKATPAAPPAPPVLRHIKVISVDRGPDRVYVTAVIDGAPYEYSVDRTTLDGLTTRAARLAFLKSVMEDIEATRRQTPYVDLLGDWDV